MNYDLTVTCMLSFEKEKHIEAAENFSKKGLLNIKNKNVLVNFLIDEKFKNYINDISFNYPYKVFYFSKNNVDHKMYNFYAFHGEKLAETANWHIQLDDDSMTDVSGLVEDLDKNYDPDIPIRFICGELCDIHPLTESILKEHGINFSNHINDKFCSDLWKHEWEFSCSTKACFKKIFNNKKTIPILRLMSSSGINGDHGLTMLAMINKIPIIHYRHAHFANLYENFSLNGGKYFHIHYIDRFTFDRVEDEFNYLKDLLKKPMKLIKYNSHEGFSTVLEKIILEKNGVIKPNNFYQNSWKRIDNDIYFYDMQNNQSCLFKFNKNFFYQHKIIPGQFTETVCKDIALLEIK